jgi:hypothetical protein
MTRKEDDVADIAVILAVTVKMAVLLVCVIVLMCTAALQQSGAVLSSPIAEAAGSSETWLRVACQYTIIFSSRVS